MTGGAHWTGFGLVINVVCRYLKSWKNGYVMAEIRLPMYGHLVLKPRFFCPIGRRPPLLNMNNHEPDQINLTENKYNLG